MFLTDTHFDTQTLTVEGMARGVSHLPSAPTVLPSVYRLIRSGDATLQQVCELVRLDPGLTARVYAMGNRFFVSEEFAEKPELATMIQQIGFDAVDAMISRVADEQVLVRPVNFYGLDAEEMWRLSVSCALAAELLAQRCGLDPDAAYHAGLFHVTGMIPIDDYVNQREPGLMIVPRAFPREFTDAERSLFGFTHADVGAEVLKRWGLSDAVCDAVRHQYAPYASARFTRLTALLYTAKWLRSVVCADFDAQTPAMPAAVILEALRLRPDSLARMVVDVRLKLGYVRNQVEQFAA